MIMFDKSHQFYTPMLFNLLYSTVSYLHKPKWTHMQCQIL